MAKNDGTDPNLNSDPNQTPPTEPEAPVEEVTVTKADYKVLSSLGLAPGGVAHRLVEPPEVLKYEDFGIDDAERETTIKRLLELGVIEPVDSKSK